MLSTNGSGQPRAHVTSLTNYDPQIMFSEGV